MPPPKEHFFNVRTPPGTSVDEVIDATETLVGLQEIYSVQHQGGSASAGRVCADCARSRSLHGLCIGGAEPLPIGAASLPACSGPYCAEGALERKFMGRSSRSTGLLWAASVQTPFVEMAPIQASAPSTQT
ncbi:hypothetical protein MTO96_037539 [Rhipicephalus appendiculatus]